MSLIPDPYKKTVRFDVQWESGRWTLVGGSELPEIRTGTVGILTMPAHSLIRDEDREEWSRESDEPLFEKGQTLWVRVRTKMEPVNGIPKKWGARGAPEPIMAVPIALDERLLMQRRTGKFGVLKPCRCCIEALKIEVESVNEAYTRISREYEKHRKSHGGNVFANVFYEFNGMLSPLEYKRGDQTDV